MSRAKNELDFEIFKKKMWRGFTFFLGVLLLIGTQVHQSRIQEIDVHIPPELGNSVVQKAGHIPKPNVYLFTSNILQALNNWTENGEQDFLQNIEAYQHYLTPSFKEQLVKLYEKKRNKGELSERIRGVQEIFGHEYDDSRVQSLASNVWRVNVDLKIREWLQGMKVKEVDLAFPLRVVRYDINRQLNPWGMALDGFIELPRKIKAKEPELANN
jgi:integrating conjugative element protein (TIGR03746 family)